MLSTRPSAYIEHARGAAAVLALRLHASCKIVTRFLTVIVFIAAASFRNVKHGGRRTFVRAKAAIGCAGECALRGAHPWPCPRCP